MADAALVEPPPPALVCEPGTTAMPAPMPAPTWACTRADGVRHGPFVTRFPDDSVEISGSYADGELAGTWTRHRVDGSIAEHGAYRAGHRDGPWRQLAASGAVLGAYELTGGTGTERTWFESGPLYRERPIIASVEDGRTVVYGIDRSPQITATMRGGKLDGRHAFGVRGNLRLEETFVAGVRRGVRKIWQRGRLIAEENYDRQGRLHGRYTLWRSYNGLRAKGAFTAGRRTGGWTWWDRSGKKEREGRYVNGQRDGAWSEWWEGRLASTGSYAVGKPNGAFMFYDRKGSELGRFTITGGTGTMLTFHGNRGPSTRQQLVEGTPSGGYEELTPSGRVVVEGTYRAGRKHGTWKHRRSDGVPLLEQRWSRGALDGRLRKFVDGRLATEATYKQGKAHGAYAEFRAGKPAVTGQFVDDQRDGTWTTLDAHGGAMMTATYKAGVLHGPWQAQRDGAVTAGEMVEGRRSGPWIRTDRTGRTTRLEYSPSEARQPSSFSPP